MPVCPRCFAYYVRAPCPYCADTGSSTTPGSRSRYHSQITLASSAQKSEKDEKMIKREIESLQGKIELLQKENQGLKGELTEKNRIIARLEADLRSIEEDKSFLLGKIAELEETKPATVAPEQTPEE